MRIPNFVKSVEFIKSTSDDKTYAVAFTYDDNEKTSKESMQKWLDANAHRLIVRAEILLNKELNLE